MIKQKEKFAIANFKMNLSARYELKHWLSNFSKARKGLKLSRAKIVLCPPVTHFDPMTKSIRSKWVEFGAQDCFWEQKGSFTGELSPRALYDMGNRYVILGHSERRRYLGETNEMVSFKLNQAIKVGLIPILCIGETADQKIKGQTMGVIQKQLEECLSRVGRGKIEKIIFCYEPVWAISSNNPDRSPTSNEILEARLVIKKYLTNSFNRILAERVKIIYGGSVSPQNVEEACLVSEMDGVLIGRASLSPYDLVKIIQIIDG